MSIRHLLTTVKHYQAQGLGLALALVQKWFTGHALVLVLELGSVVPSPVEGLIVAVVNLSGPLMV